MVYLKQIAILGSTGSIGTQALDVCRHLGYSVVAITANRDVDGIAAQAREFLPRYAVMYDKIAAARLREELAGTGITVLEGEEGLCQAASMPEAELVLNSLSGMVGLRPTLAALEAGKTVALANKETLVAGGRLITDTARRCGGRLIPVDSEHTAIFQCIQGEEQNKIKTILLTASGGPFFGKTRAETEHAEVAKALAHPKWNMGQKITVDSATLMNKGLEFIECIWNFGVRPEQIEVIVHPETIIHSAVEFEDGSVMAQLSDPDMKLSIQYALTYPHRCPSTVKHLSLTDVGKMTFYPPDLQEFPCLAMAIEAITQGGLRPCILNGANEEAVHAYLRGEISFGAIARTVRYALDHVDPGSDAYTLPEILAADQAARACARQYISTKE